MLVLSRVEGESVHLIATEPIPAGTEIVVSVEKIRGHGIRLGFDAPESVRILRSELTYLPPKGYPR